MHPPNRMTQNKQMCASTIYLKFIAIDLIVFVCVEQPNMPINFLLLIQFTSSFPFISFHFDLISFIHHWRCLRHRHCWCNFARFFFFPRMRKWFSVIIFVTRKETRSMLTNKTKWVSEPKNEFKRTNEWTKKRNFTYRHQQFALNKFMVHEQKYISNKYGGKNEPKHLIADNKNPYNRLKM